jgi:hypothetical protein
MPNEHDVRALQAEVRELSKAMAEARIRLDTGNKAFEGLREKDEKLAVELRGVQDAIAPKKPNYLAIAGLVFMMTMGLAASLWALSVLFSSRPTTEQIDKIMDKHETHPHPDTQKQINELRTGQLADQKIQGDQQEA